MILRRPRPLENTPAAERADTAADLPHVHVRHWSRSEAA